jgi:hypothetical protein
MRVALERWVGWLLYNPSYTPGVQPYRGNLALPAFSATRSSRIKPVGIRGTAGEAPSPRAITLNERK